MIISVLDEFISKHQHHKVTIGCLLEYLSLNTPASLAPGLLLVVFGLISMLPVPGPNAVLCLPLMLISLWLITDKKIRSVPHFISKRGIDHLSLKKIYEKCRPRLVFCEKFFSSRMIWAVPETNMRVIGCLVLALSFFIAIPIPVPGSNVLPAGCVVTLGCGLLFKDGLAILIAGAGGSAIMGTMSVLLYSLGKFIF